nr:hypothetical protein [Tanacetum cinerariifolium]
MFPNEAAHHNSSLPANTKHYLTTNPQHNSLQVKAKKLMQKAKKNMRKINLKKVAAQKFKEYDQKLEALTSINVSEVINKAFHVKVLTKLKKLLPTHVPKAVANYVKPRRNNFNSLEQVKYDSSYTSEAYDTLYNSITLDQEALDVQDAEPSFHKRTPDNQDPLNDHEGRTQRKEERMLHKNDVELEYHVDQLKAAVLTEAEWNVGKGDVSKPRSFERHMSNSIKPHPIFYNNEFYYLTGDGAGCLGL